MFQDCQVDGDVRWVVRRAGTDAERSDLHAEAAALRRAAHPGVVEVGSSTDPDELRTRYAGEPLVTFADMPAATLCALGSAVATILADLHDLGIAHGSLDGDHILVGTDGRPVLCGFGRGGSDGDAEPGTDVLALSSVLRQRLGASLPRRVERVAATAGRPGAARALSRALADAAAAGPPRRRARPGGSTRRPHLRTQASGPTARRGRGRVPRIDVTRETVTSSAATRRGGTRRGVTGRGVTRRAVTGLAMTGLAMTVVAVALLAVGLRWREPSAAHVAVCPGVDRGCRPVPLDDGRIVEPSGSFTVAVSDPIVVLGRWTCGPDALPAALDARSGRVWVWFGWAGPGRPVAATLASTVSDARSLRVLPDRHGCDRVGVVGADGHVTTVPGRR